ncbi:hypothetical protein SAMN05443248_8598 [Bradyrhizobium erythrophlei]|uniref:Uncharacterized protein n=1 Tax=Bradyrhizobium erythrophlei TaxID=1437360 RepID=A0A1M5YPT3_9BRAD|nr:hypothetical protein SAMN05443248_8598 [Bradyrhizobium erythrophlei]
MISMTYFFTAWFLTSTLPNIVAENVRSICAMNATTRPICLKCHKPMRLALVKGMRGRKYQCIDCEGEDPWRSRDISKLLEHLRPPE